MEKWVVSMGFGLGLGLGLGMGFWRGDEGEKMGRVWVRVREALVRVILERKQLSAIVC